MKTRSRASMELIYRSQLEYHPGIMAQKMLRDQYMDDFPGGILADQPPTDSKIQ